MHYYIKLIVPSLNRNKKNMMKQRNYMHKKERKTTNTDNRMNYHNLRNRVNNLIKKAKGAYNRQHLEENKNDSETFWKTVKKIILTERKARC